MRVFQQHKTEPNDEAICDYLRLSQVNYHMIDLLDNTLVLEKMAPHSALLRSVLLQDEEGLLMAILPQAGLLDIGLVQQHIHRMLVCASDLSLPKRSPLTETFSFSTLPPLSEYFGVSAIIDIQILEMETLYFKLGNTNLLIGLHRDAFLKLQHHVRFGPICIPMHALLEPNTVNPIHTNIIPLTPRRMKQRIQQLLHLPILPNVIGQLVNFRLENSSREQARLQDRQNDIESLIKIDPSLSLQVLSWVQSPGQSHHPPIKTVEAAVSKMLGQDLTLNLSLMTALTDPLKMPKAGRLGWQSYWRSALYAGILSDRSAQLMHSSTEEKQQLAYYSGLFHNIGLLILSELFPSYYRLLNQLMMMNSHLSVGMVEQYAFGLTHHQLAAWLMEAWALPNEIIAGLAWHKTDQTKTIGQQAKIVRLAMHLLAQQHIGEGPLIIPQKALCDELGLTQEQAAFALEKCLLQEGFIRRLTQ